MSGNPEPSKAPNHRTLQTKPIREKMIVGGVPKPPNHQTTKPPNHRATEPPSHRATEPPKPKLQRLRRHMDDDAVRSFFEYLQVGAMDAWTLFTSLAPRRRVRGSRSGLRVLSIGVLLGLARLNIDGFHWFRWVLSHLPGPSVLPKGHLWFRASGENQNDRLQWLMDGGSFLNFALKLALNEIRFHHWAYVLTAAGGLMRK